MPYAFATPDSAFAFFGLLGCLMVTSMALIWSIEDQRTQKRQKQRARKD